MTERQVSKELGCTARAGESQVDFTRQAFIAKHEGSGSRSFLFEGLGTSRPRNTISATISW